MRERARHPSTDIARDLMWMGLVTIVSLISFAAVCAVVVQGSENWKNTRIANVQP